MRTPALFSDGDGTVYRWQLILDWLDELAPQYPSVHGVLEAARPALERYRARRGSFMTYAHTIVQHFWTQKAYVGIRASDAHAAAKRVAENNRDRMYVFTRELLLAARDLNWPVIVVSGSPQEAVEEFMRVLDVTDVIATKHPVDAAGVYCGNLPVIHPMNDKGACVREYAETHNVDLSASVGIGDSHGDISMLQAVGHPVCFNPNGPLREMASAQQWPVVLEARDQLYFLRGTETAEWGVGLPKELQKRLQTRINML